MGRIPLGKLNPFLPVIPRKQNAGSLTVCTKCNVNKLFLAKAAT